MRFSYTYHARLRMGLRQVSQDMVEQAINNPDGTGTGYGGRRLAYKTFPGRGTLKVVFAQDSETIVIVTVIWE